MGCYANGAPLCVTALKGNRDEAREAPTLFLLSGFVRVNFIPPSHDFHLPVELELDFGVHDRPVAASPQVSSETIPGR